MSLLSQFFPSGGGATKIDFLLIGGGGGGGASAGYPGNMEFIGVGGGGGGGQVVIGEDYETTPGITYSITIGAGGAGGGFYFPPSFFVAPPVPCALNCTNRSMKRGGDGGDTFLGSIRALGGGGGGSGFSCVPCCSEHSFVGRSYGTGGGAGSCNDASLVANTPDAGNAIANYSLGQTIRLGTVGQKVEKSDCWESIYYSDCWYKGSSGGGGNASAGQGAGTGYIELKTPFVGNLCCSCIYESFTAVACNPFDDFKTWIPNKWCGYLSSGASLASESSNYRASHQYSYHGVDGYRTCIEGTDCYYGGGGSVAWSIIYFGNLYHGVAMDPSNPCWPTFSNYACYACPYGGLGGGATIKANAVKPSSPYYVGQAGPQLGYPCCCLLDGRVLYNGESGLGGGGAAHYLHGQPNTGPIYPGYTQCAYCGTNGGSGVVIIRYPTNFAAATVTGNAPTTPQSGYHVYKWTSPGTIKFN